MIKELKYDLTKEDLINFAKDCVHAKQYKKQRWIFSCILGIIYFIILLILFNLDGFNCTNLICTVVGTFITTIIMYFLYPLRLKQSVKNFSKGIDLNDNTIIINSDSNTFKGSSKRGSSEWNWSEFKYIYNFKYSILLFFQEYQAIFIPKRIFESEQEMNETWELIQECYNKNREELR